MKNDSIQYNIDGVLTKLSEGSSPRASHDADSAPVPLNAEQIAQIFDAVDWSVVHSLQIKPTYHEFRTTQIFKVCTLPFLIEIATERALETELVERSRLKTLCGFSPGDNLPSRATLWHFRNSLSRGGFYGEAMLYLLLMMMWKGAKLRIDLPFVIHRDNGQASSGDYRSITLSEHFPEMDLLFPSGRSDEFVHFDRSERCFVEDALPVKSGVAKGVRMPFEVRVKRRGNSDLIFGMILPPWLRTSTTRQDTVSSVGPANETPYRACNVIVSRMRDGTEEILLSIKLEGSAKGKFVLPGGKQRGTESVRECAERELREETGLKLLHSKPVSVVFNPSKRNPLVWVASFGILAVEYEGTPRTREPHQHLKWQWFKIDDLPHNLFDPARQAINHYRTRAFINLEWSDIETTLRGNFQLTMFRQELDKKSKNQNRE